MLLLALEDAGLDVDFRDLGEAHLIDDIDDLGKQSALVGIDQHPRVSFLDLVALDAVEKFVEGDHILVPREGALRGNRKRHRAGGVARDAGFRRGQLDRQPSRLVQRERKENEGGEQEEDDVDQRDDLNARSFSAAVAGSTTMHDFGRVGCCSVDGLTTETAGTPWKLTRWREDQLPIS